MSKHIALAKTKLKFREVANEHMTMLEQNPERVMSYFQDRRVRSAAEYLTEPEQQVNQY